MSFPVKMKPATIERRRREREQEQKDTRELFENNVLMCKHLYPQFAYPETLPEESSLYLVNETGKRGPKGYPEAISIGTRVRYEEAF